MHYMHLTWRKVVDVGSKEIKLYVYLYVYWGKVAAIMTTWLSASIAKDRGVRGILHYNGQSLRHKFFFMKYKYMVKEGYTCNSIHD